MNKTVEYIKKSFPKTLRHNTEDDGTLIGLPYPYTVPCAENYFNELFYWDTYFTNKALILLGNVEQAKNNVLDIAYLIERFGYMPNGSRMFFLKRSQPPFFVLMVRDVYEATGDKEFLSAMLAVIKKEYAFWSSKRTTDNGLNRYGTEEDDNSCVSFLSDVVAPRIAVDLSRDSAEAGRSYFAEAESGWDFTPRFGGRCAECNAVDLNGLLYICEKLIGEYESLLGIDDGLEWANLAERRRQLINTLLWDNSACVYKDRNAVSGELSNVVSAAAFMPYFAGIAEKDNVCGLTTLINALECDCGLFATAKTDEKFQWAYPNVWAPYHLLACDALMRYNMNSDAERIAKKYVALIESNYEKTGMLYEKYNGLTGGIDAVSEYGTPEMLGWTAGVYLYLLDKFCDGVNNAR